MGDNQNSRMTNTQPQNIFELHYYFIDDEPNPHSMDAFVRNRCENELLQIIGAISKELNIQVTVETEAHKEGGLREFYTFLGTAEGQAILSAGTLITAILGLIISRIPPKKTKLDKEEQELSIEEKRLNIEAQKLNIELMKKELGEKKIQSPNINIDKINFIVNENIKIIKHKSNFGNNIRVYTKYFIFVV